MEQLEGNIQQSAEFQTSKFYCKTDFNMAELKEEEDNLPESMPIYYDFKSKENRERKLYELFVQVNQDVSDMIKQIQMKHKKE